jgi:hypothetical protein
VNTPQAVEALSRIESPKRRARFLLISVFGGIAIVSLTIWQTGFGPFKFWPHAVASKALPISKAPAQPSTKAIGLIPPTPRGNDSSISPERLKLILVQVRPGRNATEGSAELGVVRESPQTYQAGALLENGARLAEIHSDYVVLMKDGRSAQLYLENATSPPKVSNVAMLMVGGAVESPPPAKITSREVLTDYIRPSPVYDGVTFVGYQVYPATKSSPFHQMGLLAGDVIVEVNNIPLTSSTTSWDLLRGLADGVVLSVVVKRSTGVQQLTLDGMLLVNAEESQRNGSAQAMLTPPIQ